jgi:ATP-binding cassette subfamily C protein CydCD
MGSIQHPRQTWLRVLGRPARIGIGLAALASFLERLAIVAATFELLEDRTLLAMEITGCLAVIFVARSAARSFLRVHIQTNVIGAVSAGLVAEDGGLRESQSEDTELQLFDGLYASETLLGEHLPQLLGDIPACVCMLIVASQALPGRLVLEGSLTMILGALAVLAARRATTRSSDLAWEALGPVLDDLSIAVRGRLEIVASGTSDAFLSLVNQKTLHWRRVASRAAITSFLAGRAPTVAVALAVALVLVLDAGLRGTVSHGVLGRAALLASMTPAFAGLARAWLEIGKGRARLRPIAGLIADSKTERRGGDGPPSPRAEVAFERVSFAYGSLHRRVIDELVETWRAGEIIALTGPNGSGKSTLLSLLLGLREPTTGAISVGGKDLREIDRQLWRRRVGYLPQRPFLYDRATIGDAMRLIAPDADVATLESSLRQVRLWGVLVARSPDAPLETKVGTLSAGEKQRLAIARVLSRRAELLVLDEPDANLDVAGLELLKSLLRDLAGERMIVMAVHSPSLVESADRVVDLGRADAVSDADAPRYRRGPAGGPALPESGQGNAAPSAGEAKAS